MSSIFSLISEKIELKKSQKEIKKTKFGKGYFILPNKNDKLLDVTDELGSGTNDHIGISTSLENGKLFGIPKPLIKKAKSEIDEGQEDLNTLNQIWDIIYNSGAIKVRVLKTSKVSQVVLTFSFKKVPLVKIQQHLIKDRIPMIKDANYYFADGLGSREEFDTNLVEIMVSNSISEIK